VRRDRGLAIALMIFLLVGSREGFASDELILIACRPFQNT
jgi:hypothetical protein